MEQDKQDTQQQMSPTVTEYPETGDPEDIARRLISALLAAGNTPIIIRGGSPAEIEVKRHRPSDWREENDTDSLAGDTASPKKYRSDHPRDKQITRVDVIVPGTRWCMHGFTKAQIVIHYTDPGSPESC